MEQCAVKNAIVLTVATSQPYLDAAGRLAESARDVGFPCITIALPSPLLSRPLGPLLVPLLLPPWVHEWLPEPHFCAGNASLRGWRQTHILKTQALLHVIRAGTDALVLDCDRLLIRNPLEALRASNVDVAA
eukprot:2423050-Prymnesium_polylepis.1